MRKLGLIGGMSWISTQTYYRQINRLVQKQLGPVASPPLLLEALDFRDHYDLREDAQWEQSAKELSETAKRLEDGGSTAILITSNVMHKVYEDVAAAVSVPVIHIADCVGKKMAADKIERATLLGKKSVMTEGFFRKMLVAHGVDLMPPDAEAAEQLDRIITAELKLGKATRDAERALKTIITVNEQQGAKAIILACTELEQVVDIDANVLPIYDTTRIHCEAAADWILTED